MINNKGVEEFPLLDKLVENAVFPKGVGMRQEKTELEKLADQHSVAIMELVKRIEALEDIVNNRPVSIKDNSMVNEHIALSIDKPSIVILKE